MEELVADEVEDKAMFSLHRVAEEFATRKNYAEVGVVSNSQWNWEYKELHDYSYLTLIVGMQSLNLSIPCTQGITQVDGFHTDPWFL